METFAIGRPDRDRGRVSLWCEPRGLSDDGGIKFWVINGHWEGVLKDGYVTVDHQRWPAVEVWRGEVPKIAYQINDAGTGRDYNSAIAWIESQLEIE